MADPSKTEKATPRRRQDARKQGQVSKSIEASAAVSFLSGLLFLKFFGQGLFIRLKDYLTYMLSNLHRMEFSEQNILALQLEVMTLIAYIVIPFMIIIVIGVVAVNAAQVGFLLTLQPLKPALNKINPLNGIKHLLSKKGIENLVKSMLKLVIISWLVYGVLKKNLPEMIPLATVDIQQSFQMIVNICYQIAIRVALFFIIVAIMDYAWQRYMFEQTMKMSKQEVKDEMKRMEGNPQIKGEIRKRMRQMMRNRMMAAVPKADVVVTNPTHIAVALRYDAAAMSSPRVVAKGARLIAEQIKKVAQEAGVPVIEDKPLARSLFQTVEVGEEIPEDLFNAVAEILTYVHKLTGRSFGL